MTAVPRPDDDPRLVHEPSVDEAPSHPGSRPAAQPTADEQLPPGGGIIRRLSAGTKGVGGVVGVFDQAFAPTHHEARQILEAQRRVGKPAPSPTDPPDLTPDPGAGPAGRFGGRILLHRPTGDDPLRSEDGSTGPENGSPW